jgi:hypothetical protein
MTCTRHAGNPAMGTPEAWFLDVPADQRTLSVGTCVIFMSSDTVIRTGTGKKLSCDNAEVSSKPRSVVHQKCCIPPL